MAKEVKNFNRVPPQNIEAEISILGALLINKNTILKIADILSPPDFYEEKHRMIFEAILNLYEHRQPVDLVTLTNKLQEKGFLEKVGGASYLATLANSVPTASHAVHYAEIVADKAILRRLIDTASEIVETVFKEGGEANDVLDKSEKLIFQIAHKQLKQDFASIGPLLSEAFDRLDELHKDKSKFRGIPTGFRDLDNFLAGLQPSDLIILAGRPSTGKTTLALNIARNIATKLNIPVGIFSLEQSREQIIDRFLCSEANIDSWKLRTGNLEDEDFPKIAQAMAVLSEAPLFVDDSAVLNSLEIRTKARRLQADHGLGLLIVDYLQLIQGHSRTSEGRVQEMSEISRSLKALAKELNVPIIALSQLSREVEKRPSKIPQLADLRESGSIEQDADVVMFIYREDYYNPDTERKNITDILIKKHRNGPTGQVEVYFHPEHMAFRNLDKKRDGVE